MPSIFIWKAMAPSSSKGTIRMYMGSNWVLEDNELSSKSYVYLDQIIINNNENAISESANSVITFNTKFMPRDWVGSDLLEVACILYEKIKSDEYGTLERIGDWLRFIPNSHIEFEEDNLKLEFSKIQNWMNIRTASKTYNTKVENKKQNYNQSQIKNQNIPIKHKSMRETTVIDQSLVQNSFQDFLNKYTMQLYGHNIQKDNSRVQRIKSK